MHQHLLKTLGRRVLKSETSRETPQIELTSTLLSGRRAYLGKRRVVENGTSYRTLHRLPPEKVGIAPT